MSFFSSIEGALKKFFTTAPKWENIAQGTLTLIAPLVKGIAASTASESDQKTISAIIDEIQTDLAVTSAAISTGSTGGATVALTSLQTNLGALLTAGHIKDPATLQKVQGIATIVIGEVSAILAVVPKTSAPPAA